jgi:hypothetical protein
MADKLKPILISSPTQATSTIVGVRSLTMLRRMRGIFKLRGEILFNLERRVERYDLDRLSQ